MRILLVNDHARVTGGADVHCFDLDRLLRERGHETRLLSTRHPENILDRGAFIPQIVDRAGRDSLSPLEATRVFAKSCWNRDAAAATERLIAAFQPDIVHAHKLYPQLSVAPMVVAARHSVPVVQTAHDYEFVSASALDDAGRWYDRDETRASYRLLNAVLFRIKRTVHVPRVASWIAVSRDLADVYRQRGGIDAQPLPNFVIGGGAALPLAARSGALYVGRLTREKGVEQVIEVARRLPELPVTVAGFGPLTELVTRAAEEIPNLVFEGALDQAAVERRMRSAQLVLMPGTWREPAGLVALEAMRAGTPVVAYDHGGLAEYVRDAGAGLVVPPTLDDLIDAATSLLGNRDGWNKLAENALSAAGTIYSPETYIDKLERLYAATAQSPALASDASVDRESR